MLILWRAVDEQQSLKKYTEYYAVAISTGATTTS